MNPMGVTKFFCVPLCHWDHLKARALSSLTSESRKQRTTVREHGGDILKVALICRSTKGNQECLKLLLLLLSIIALCYSTIFTLLVIYELILRRGFYYIYYLEVLPERCARIISAGAYLQTAVFVYSQFGICYSQHATDHLSLMVLLLHPDQKTRNL